MNKSRRQVTETAEALVASGRAVLIIDVYGTGDSGGEFSAATWRTWKAEIESAMSWADNAALPVEDLVATRLGCVLAAASLKENARSVRRSVFWQPVDNGRRHIAQFLRLRVASSAMSSSESESVDDLRTRLDGGEIIEVAGYELSPRLWKDIEAADLAASLSVGLGDLMIIEAGVSGGPLSAVGQRLADTAAELGLSVSGEKITGDPFWVSTEIVTNPLLTEITTSFLVAEAAAR